MRGGGGGEGLAKRASVKLTACTCNMDEEEGGGGIWQGFIININVGHLKEICNDHKTFI